MDCAGKHTEVVQELAMCDNCAFERAERFYRHMENKLEQHAFNAKHTKLEKADKKYSVLARVNTRHINSAK